MSVIIRLQNLPWSANALDIRQYFHGLSIPEGGVHIVGGELGDAFIAFSTDEDARQAMLIDGGKIKEVKIKLFLSSRSEMQKVIETARAQSISMQTFMQMPSAQIPATQMTATQIPPTPPQTAPALPPMPPISQVPPKTATPEIKAPPLPPLPSIVATTPEITKSELEPEKKDQDTESISSRDAKRSRRGRSRSKSKNRSKSRDRSKSRERSKSRDRSRSRDRNYRSKDRYRDRRRRDRSRSRDRRDRRRYRDRSRSRDRSSRKTSRDRKRDADRNDQNSVENSSGAKNVIVPENEEEIPLPNTPAIAALPTALSGSATKPGFSTTGWVAAGAADKSSGSILPSPIGFSIGKLPPNAAAPSHQQPPLPRNNVMSSPQQIPLPQQMQLPNQMQTTQQIPTTQSTPTSHPMHIPQPPSFPQLGMEIPKDHDGRFGPMSFPNNTIRQPPNIPTTQQNVLFGSNPSQFSQNEPNTIMPQNDMSKMSLLQTPTGWMPMRPPMDHAHMLGSLQSTQMTVDKSVIPSPMNMGMGMYIRPSGMDPNNQFQTPYSQQDPRMQSGFPPQQPRNDYRSDRPFPQMNNFSPQKQTNFAAREYDSTNPRDVFSNACVEIRNMSMNTTNGDIRRFFQGLQIPGDGVKIITDKKGNKVGMAYVRFTKAFFKDLALKKTGQSLKNSVVEILHIDDNIFDKAADFSEYSPNYFEGSQGFHENYDNYNDQDGSTEVFTDIVIHEVPSYAKDRDIYNLFKGLKISDAFVLLRTGRKTATGYVRFRTPADARKALATSSRLAIGYTNVKPAICYEHEFADARDRKNMEENDEEMMDPKDAGFPPHETRGHRDSKKYQSYELSQERPDPRYNPNEKKTQVSKGLLPTPTFKPFDPRPSTHASNSNSTHNFQSRFDRRQQDVPPRKPREDFHKKPYGREEFHQKSLPRESGRFQPKSSSREEQSKKLSQGELYKNTQEQEELQKKSQSLQYPLNTTKHTTVSETSTPVREVTTQEALITDSDDRIENKNENQLEAAIPDSGKNKAPEPIIPNNAQSAIPLQNVETIIHAETPPSNSQSVKQGKETSLSGENNEVVSSAGQRNHMEVKSEELNENMPGPVDFIETDCIILRGLPFTATDRDILDFFSDVGLAPTQIHIMLDKHEQPAGDAFCEFNAVEEVSRAMTKNKTLMGRSLVSVEPVCREEMMEALGAVVPHPDHPHPDFTTGYPQPEYHRQDYRFPRMPSSSGYPPPFLIRGRGRGGSFRGRYLPPAEREVDSQNVNAFGKPGCVVALENVPFRAEVQDIIDYFRGFYVPRDNVIRRFDENGKPTGDARVCFSSPLEAHRALRTLNYRQIFNRKIHLTLVP